MSWLLSPPLFGHLSGSVKPLTKSSWRRLWLGSSRFSSRKVQVVIPGLVSLQGWWPSPYRNLSPVSQWWRRHQDDPPLFYLLNIIPADFLLASRAKSELASLHCPRRASGFRAIQTMPRTRSSKPFGSGWTAAKSTSAAVVTKPKNIPK